MAISVKRDQSGPMRHVVRIRSHSFVVDEPPANGGEDSGPTPHDIYDAALGACKALTLVWFARRKGMPLEDVEVSVERDASQERDGVYRLRTQLSVSGELSDEQRQQLLAVAVRCPLHRLMTEVRTEVETVWK
jgi:putative redox protein